MRWEFVFLMLVGFGLFPLQAASAQENEIASQPISIGKSFQLPSKIYETNREVNVFLPPGYDTSKKKYSVLYVVDGGLQQDFHHISGLGQLPSLNFVYQELIVVGVKTENRLMELAHQPTDPRYAKDPPQSGRSDLFFGHLQNEVIPFIEKSFRTGDRKALMGESLAGLFIVETFLKHPNAFTDFIAISPSLWWDDQNLAKSSERLLAEHDDAKRQLYLTMASEGGTMQAGLDKVLKAIKKVELKNLTWHYVDRSKTESHASIYHGAALDALRKLFAVPQPKYTTKPWYLIEGAQPPTEKPESKEDDSSRE